MGGSLLSVMRALINNLHLLYFGVLILNMLEVHHHLLLL
jgi:hypothetical protein